MSKQISNGWKIIIWETSANRWILYTWAVIVISNIISVFLIFPHFPYLGSIILHSSILSILSIIGLGLLLPLLGWKNNLIIISIRIILTVITTITLYYIAISYEYLPGFIFPILTGWIWFGIGVGTSLIEIMKFLILLIQLIKQKEKKIRIPTYIKQEKIITIFSISLICGGVLLFQPTAYGFHQTIEIQMGNPVPMNLYFWGEPVNGGIKGHFDNNSGVLTVKPDADQILSYCRDNNFTIIPGGQLATFQNETKLAQMTLIYQLYKNYSINVVFDAWIGAFIDDTNYQNFTYLAQLVIDWRLANDLTNIKAIVADVEHSSDKNHYNSTRHAQAIQELNHFIDNAHDQGVEIWSCPLWNYFDLIDDDNDLDLMDSLPLIDVNWDVVMPQIYRSEYYNSLGFSSFELFQAVSLLKSLSTKTDSTYFPFLGVIGTYPYTNDSEGLNQILVDIDIVRSLNFTQLGFYTLNRFHQGPTPVGILNNYGFEGLDKIMIHLVSPPENIQIPLERDIKFIQDPGRHYRRFALNRMLYQGHIVKDIWLNWYTFPCFVFGILILELIFAKIKRKRI